ncbi:hypothetical protein M514_22526 [Trichuris suis]|uniref:Uncharacterized protein n=1 Tax=Trichuris suis TaxID=68888 RepID=A0A085N702_9BILA|nr:hypothetical protein M514_22526 [Trichuris suis]
MKTIGKRLKIRYWIPVGNRDCIKALIATNHPVPGTFVLWDQVNGTSPLRVGGYENATLQELVQLLPCSGKLCWSEAPGASVHWGTAGAYAVFNARHSDCRKPPWSDQERTEDRQVPNVLKFFSVCRGNRALAFYFYMNSPRRNVSRGAWMSGTSCR